MEADAAGATFLFGDFRLDQRGLFQRDQNGIYKPIAAGSRALDLLRVLVERRGKLVGKGEITAAVWPGLVIESSNLTVQISALRRILDQGRAEGSCIQTIARRGYRFVPTVTQHQADPDSDGTAVAAAGANCLPPRLSIAVLPFTNLSNDPDQDYFADGITDDLTTDLSRIPGSFVISRTSAFTYKGKAVDAKQVGRELGVRYVLEGSVRRLGDQVRVNAQLIDAETDAHLWAERFDRDVGDLFALQDEITGHVVRILEIEPVEAGPRTGRLKAVDPDLADPGAGYRRAERLKEIGTGISSANRGLVAKFPYVPQIQPERRLLTVLSCGIAGVTPPARDLDPEEALAKMAGLHNACTEVVARHGGFVARFHSDGLLAYFGYPQAHEDDAERAVRAALGLADAIGRFEMPDRLRAHLGISTGVVVIGDLIGEGQAQERGIVGETPKLAEALQALAEPDMVVIAASTRRLLGDLFEYRDLGAIEVKGITAPVPASRVLRQGTVASRFEALHGSLLTRLVGRDEEIDLLLRRWARAKTGDGQVVLVFGEPGIGKSRIAATLEERLQTQPHLRLRYFCSPFHLDSALFPFIDQLGRAAGFAREDPSAVKLEKLEALLARAAAPEEDMAFLADLFSLPASERHPLPNLSPQRKKERTLEALIHQLEDLARRQPVLMVFEDAHWIDPTSRELLDLIVERACCLPVLLIVTFRPEFQPSWIGQPHVTMLALNRLDRHDRTALAMQIAGGKALPGEVIDQIVDRTDGVPLFVEELTKSVLESGLLREEAVRYVLDGALPPFAIPTSLHASLLARLDRLASVRHLAQIGAVIGREFSYPLLRAVSRLPEGELQAALRRLVTSELVFQRGTAPHAVCAFKHTLVQDVAHDSLLRSSRQRLHAQIAEALETHSPELMDSQPELFAQHYAEARLVEKSVACWAKAGHRSAARSAMAEAAAQLQKGLDQLALLPDDSTRQRQELEFCTALSAVLHTVKGLAAPETGHAHARARELWEQLGSPSEFVGVPYAEAGYHTFRGEFDLAQRLIEDLLRLSCQRDDSAGLVLGHYYCGLNLLCTGRFASARAHLERAVALYDRISHGSLVHQAGIHPQVISQGWLGLALLCLGFPDQALVQCGAAIAEARRLAHPPSLAGSLALGARLFSLLGDDAALAEEADELVAVATDQGFPYWRAQGVTYRGWIEVKNGDMTEGLSLLRGATTAYRATGAKWYVPHYIALQAGACEIVGQIEEALALLDGALEIVERTGERWFAAELNRHKGQLLLRQGHTEAAEDLYCKALSIAREQEAKLWELRAAASLARLRRDQGRQPQARDLLARVNGWFTEGFETPDLKEAKVLLAELE